MRTSSQIEKERGQKDNNFKLIKHAMLPSVHFPEPHCAVEQCISTQPPAPAKSAAALLASACKRMQKSSVVPSHYPECHFVSKQGICCRSNPLITC